MINDKSQLSYTSFRVHTEYLGNYVCQYRQLGPNNIPRYLENISMSSNPQLASNENRKDHLIYGICFGKLGHFEKTGCKYLEIGMRYAEKSNPKSATESSIK